MTDPTTAVMERTADHAPVPLASEVSVCPPHHFVIESPHGEAVSSASCRKCGAQREYRIWLEQYDYVGTAWKRAAS